MVYNETPHTGGATGCCVREHRHDPVSDNQDDYKRMFVKIFSIHHSIDIKTSKAQTPHSLQDHHSVHVAEVVDGEEAENGDHGTDGCGGQDAPRHPQRQSAPCPWAPHGLLHLLLYVHFKI